MRIRLVAEAHSAMDLDVLAGIVQRSRACNEQRALDLESRVIASLINRNSSKACLVAGPARGADHVGAMMLDRLETADRAAKLRARSRVGNGHLECRLGDACEGSRIDQPQTQQLRCLESGYRFAQPARLAQPGKPEPVVNRTRAARIQLVQLCA